jgi:hypothetical protein
MMEYDASQLPAMSCLYNPSRSKVETKSQRILSQYHPEHPTGFETQAYELTDDRPYSWQTNNELNETLTDRSTTILYMNNDIQRYGQLPISAQELVYGTLWQTSSKPHTTLSKDAEGLPKFSESRDSTVTVNTPTKSIVWVNEIATFNCDFHKCKSVHNTKRGLRRHKINRHKKTYVSQSNHTRHKINVLTTSMTRIAILITVKEATFKSSNSGYPILHKLPDYTLTRH